MRKKNGKLNLNRETLVNLNPLQRQSARGAVAAGPSEPGHFTCNETVCGTCSCDTLEDTYCCCIPTMEAMQ